MHPHKSNSWAGERWSTPTFPNVEWITDHQYICKKPVLEIEVTEAVVLVSWGCNPVLWKALVQRRGFSKATAWDIQLALSRPVRLAGRTVQVEGTINTLQEGCTEAIMDAVMEKKMHRPEGPGCPLRVARRATWYSAVTCNINNWIQWP